MTHTVIAPGRVNLIGEHIDYHNLDVLPMALEQRIRVDYRARTDHRITARSSFGVRAFEWEPFLKPVAAGDWENYLRAAAEAIAPKWGIGVGIDAEVTSNLPPAAGLSSSSALLVAFTLALLRANGHHPSFEELMDVLPEGEHFVGTRGGGMDHAASLASRAGHASLIGFAPVTLRHISIPADWTFFVAPSLKVAEKSGAVREEYNARRALGSGAPRKLGYAGYREALEANDTDQLDQLAHRLEPGREREAFLHVVTEAHRVHDAVRAMTSGNAQSFGNILLASHASLRDRLMVSCAELDILVEMAIQAGALGARLTGAGFGGCAVVFCLAADAGRVRNGLIASFYQGDVRHLIQATPGNGALYL